MKIWRFMKCLDHCILKSVKHKRTTVICFPFLSTCDLVCGGRVRITSRISGRTSTVLESKTIIGTSVQIFQTIYTIIDCNSSIEPATFCSYLPQKDPQHRFWYTDNKLHADHLVMSMQRGFLRLRSGSDFVEMYVGAARLQSDKRLWIPFRPWDPFWGNHLWIPPRELTYPL